MQTNNVVPLKNCPGAEELSQKLADNCLSICQHLLPNGKKNGKYYEAGSVYGEKGKSLKVDLTKARFADYASDDHGDMLDLWKASKGISTMYEAIIDVADYFGLVEDFVADTSKADVEDYKPHVHGKVTGTWDYYTADGKKWATVTRYQHPLDAKRKDFMQFNYENKAYGLPKGGNRPVYRLTELLKTQDTVIITEGEKCADKLASLGYTTTTSICGANGADKADWSQLQGRDVILWPDNDDAGLKYAESLKELLQKADVQSFSVLPLLEDKPHKWDAFDAIEEGWQKEDVEKYLDTKEVLYSEPTIEERLGFSLNDFAASTLSGEPPVREYTVKNIFPKNAVSVLAAPGGVGKSMILIDLALKLSTGCTSFAFGNEVEAEGHSIIFSAEDDLAELHRRIDALDPTGSRFENPYNIFFVPLPDVEKDLCLFTYAEGKVQPTSAFNNICKLVLKQENVAMISIDPLQAFVQIDMNNPTHMQAVLNHLNRLAKKAKCSIVLPHHMSKRKEIRTAADAREAVRGTSGLVDGVRAVYALYPDPDAKDKCDKYDIEYRPNALIKGDIVKSNGPADLSSRLFLRNSKTGLLEEFNAKNRKSLTNSRQLQSLLLNDIAEAALNKQPLTHTGKSGLYQRRQELHPELKSKTKKELEELGSSLIKGGQIRKDADHNNHLLLCLPNTAETY